MNELIKVTYDNDRVTVLARDLHEFLEVSTRYNDWFKRMCEYGFDEDIDYQAITQKRVTAQGNEIGYTDHQLTLDMAKEISMLQRNEKGKQARHYFIECEKKLKSNPLPATYKQALQELLKQVEYNEKLQLENSAMKPKVEYFDNLVDRNLLTNIRDTAKELHIRQSDFVEFLLNKFVYRDSKGKLKPYAEYSKQGLFELKEFTRNNHADVQMLITPKGRETFRLLLS